MSAAPALLLFLVLHGVFFTDVVFEGRSLSASTLTAGLTPTGPLGAPGGDVPHLLDVEGAAWVDEPSPYLASAAFAAGELPLWNPATGLGSPLAANLNSGAGNPLQLPLDLWPSPAHADAFYLTRLLVLACATWVFLRELRLTPLAAWLGAIVATYGGYPLAWIAHHPLSTELFLPVMLAGFERGRAGRAGGWMLLAAGAAGSLLGGKLQASLLCFAFVGLWAGLRAPRTAGGAGAATPLAAVVGLVVGAGLAGFLLLPAFELMARASGLTLGGRSQLAAFQVPWSSLASLAVPALFAGPDRVFPDGLLTPSIGIAAFVLALVGAAAPATPLRHVARGGVAWAAVLLLRNVGAFGDVAVHLPVLHAILFVKYTFTIVFALAIAAAIGADALLAGRIDARTAPRVVGAGLMAVAVVVAAALATGPLATHPAALAVPAAVAALLAIATMLWRLGVGGRTAIGAVFVSATLVELWAAAPHRHPPRVDPYRPPPFVAFLRDATPGRLLADPDLAPPLTSAAAGLADARSIDVLTPGASYAFFLRLVSFCDRVIHFTVDPDVTLAATAPAADLAGVRWIVSRRPLAIEDVARRVRRQVGRERTARLLAGLRRLSTAESALAIGPVVVDDDDRFAFTLTTPFTLDVTAETEAAELAFGVLVRGAGEGIILATRIDGVPSDAAEAAEPLPIAEHWADRHVALGHAGERRRVRVRIHAASADGVPATVSLGDLGFGPGEAIEARLARERIERHVGEASALREVFRDPEVGAIVYENVNALPRAFRVRDVEPTPSEETALGRLGDGFDFRHAALVPTEDVVAVRAALAADDPQGRAAARTDDAGTATVRGATPGSVTIATDGPASAVLVLADLAYPGWRADVDGRPVAVHVVDGVLRGVIVPAGPHVVTFRYRPTSLAIGAGLTVVALVLLVPYGRGAARRHRDEQVA